MKESMETFLSKLSDEIAAKYDKPSDLCVVLPSRRAGTFFKRALSKSYQKTIQLPNICTLDDFVTGLSSLKLQDQLSAFFTLFEDYQELLLEEKEQPEELDRFINWAPTLLSDFNEIDKYGVNSLEIFAYINDIRALETWNLDGNPLTEHQRNYLKLWKRFGKLYHKFKRTSLKNKEAHIGLIFRTVAEKIEDIYQTTNYEHVIFAGFNALSTTENKIIAQFVKTKKGSIFWDTDEYYVKDNNQEAGLFFRRLKKEKPFTHFQWEEQNFKTTSKTINIYNCNTNYAQSILTAELLSQNTGKELNTAVILNKEDALLPLLNALPDNISAANITMGYELKLTPLAGFINVLLDLWHSNTGKEKSAFYHKNVIQFLEHNYASLLIDDQEKLRKLKTSIVKFNKVYVGKKLIHQHIGAQTLLKTIFSSEQQNVLENTKKILKVLSALKDALTNSNSDKFDKSLQIEFVYHYTLVFRRILEIATDRNIVQNCSLKVFKLLINQLVNKQKIAFYGEPLQGIQIMGMLESRALDFEQIILLSVNEGVLPAGKKNHSLIPYDLKREFGLPTHTENDAIYANHFYRLIQRAKKIDILYHTGSDDFGAGTEKSRFIEQIQHELPKYSDLINISTHEYNPVPTVVDNTLKIPCSSFLIQKIRDRLSKGLSPSAMNTLAACRMDFYYKYLIGLGEQDEVEENIKSSTLGTCIHDALEKMHEESLGTAIDQAAIKKYKKNADQLLKIEFERYFSPTDLKTGSNLLTFEVAKSYVKKFLDFELSLVKECSYMLIQVEENIAHSLDIIHKNENIPIKIHGKVDAVAQLGDEMILLDYKTGKVESKELNIRSISELYAGTNKKSKALQLLTYAWMYYQKHPETEHISPCIYSFKNSKEGFMKLTYNKKTITKKEVIDLFPQVIDALIQPLLDESTSIQHESKSLYCEYCTPNE